MTITTETINLAALHSEAEAAFAFYAHINNAANAHAAEHPGHSPMLRTQLHPPRTPLQALTQRALDGAERIAEGMANRAWWRYETARTRIHDCD